MPGKLFTRAGILLLFISVFFACKKNSGGIQGGGTTPDPPKPPADTSVAILPQVDPPVAATIGFFLNDWQGKNFTAPATMAGTVPTGDATDALTINYAKVLTKVPKYVYGNNSVLWMGQIVTESSLMGYIRDLSPNIIRAPAGSVSDIYFWKDALTAPADAPDNIYSNGAVAPAGYWFGGHTEDWTLKLSNYYQLLSQTNSTGIITVNYGYARYGTSTNPVATAAHLAADWVRYDNGRTKYWEIGNETYGNWEAGYQIDPAQNKDGQPAIITGDLYGRHVKVFADSMRAAAAGIGATIYIGASLVDAPPYNGAYAALQTWNQGVLTQAGNTADYFIVHDYFTDYNTNSTATAILNTGVTIPTNGMTYVKQQLSQYGVGVKPIALTEWNIQAVGSKQDVSYIAGLHAAKALGAIIKNNFGEASRWDLANGWDNGNDQGLFNVGDEPGAPKWNPRPAFYYLYYFQKFFGDRMVSDSLSPGVNTDLTTYSSSFSSGQAGTVIVNSGTTPHVLSIRWQNFAAGSQYYWYVLTGGTDNGDFSGQVYVNGTGPSSATGGPLTYSSIKAYSATLTGITLKVTVPARAAVYLVADKK